ncbi:MAG: LamG domain-containing protein [Chloracidobacterium sp.]|nr:LamG domain-containing protein [Chloracidobacterium sp.]
MPAVLENAGSCTPAPVGMINWWSGDGNTYDIRGWQNGSLIGDVTYSDGKVQQAFSLDGNDDFVNLAVPNILTIPGTDVTVDFWMYWNGQATPDLGQMPFGFHRYDLYFYEGGFGFNAGSELWGMPSDGLANRWVHVAGIFHNGNVSQSRLFIDGVEQQLSARIGTPGVGYATDDARIGGWLYDNDYDFSGKVDELEIFNRALTQQEIQAIVNAGRSGVCKPTATIPPAGIVGWWGGDGFASDISGNANHATLMNGAGFTVGKVGQAFSLDGINDIVEVPHNPNINFGATQPMSFDVWLFRTSDAAYQPIFS